MSPSGGRSSTVVRAREIVLEYGWNATSYQILNPGIDHWFSETQHAVIGYTRKYGVLLVAGAPVCSWDALEAVCAEFEQFARSIGCTVCYVCAEERLRILFEHSPDHAIVALGAQPSWDPRRWDELIRLHGSLRAQVRRAMNKGVVVESLPAEAAATNDELRRVLLEWVAGRHLPPLHFLVEPNVLDSRFNDRKVHVARRDGRAIAFLVASPIRDRAGYLFELLARAAEAPNGASELLIDVAMRELDAEGCRFATLGLVALAHAADDEIHGNPAWLRGLMYFARAHANRFYNFRGLEQFRAKMLPERWEPVYAISNERRFSLLTLYAMGAAFSGIPPWAAIALGIGKAARDEVRRLFGRGRNVPIGRRLTEVGRRSRAILYPRPNQTQK